MQRAPASGGQAGLAAEVEPTAVERLDRVGNLLAEKKPWPAFLQITARATEEWEACPTPVQEALTWMATATVGVLDIASVGPLVPVCQAFKALIEAAEGAAESHDKLQGLVSRCAFLTTVLIQHHRVVGPLAQVQKPMKDFIATTNNLAAFAAKWAKGGKRRAFEGLRGITNDIALVDGLEHHQLLLAMHGHLRPPTLPGIAAVPRGAISLTDAHVSRPSLLERAVDYLTNTARGDAPCVLIGMAGGGKSVLASAVVRDERIREHFSTGIFWWRVGRDAKDQLHEWLEGLVLRVASSSGTSPPMLASVEKVTRYLKEFCADAVSPRLVVLDNVWEQEVVDALQLTGLQLLVTTRDRSVVSMPGECVEVGDMEEDEALEVLRVGCGAPKNLELPRLEALQGKYEEAGPLFERTLQVFGAAVGEEHPGYASALNNRALLLIEQGKYDEGRPLFVRATEILGNVLHPFWQATAALNNRAAFLESQGKHAEAEPLPSTVRPSHKRSQAIREKVLGPEHADVARSLNNPSGVVKKGTYSEAERLCERSQAILEKVLGPEHPDMAFSLSHRATFLAYQGKYCEAKPLHERSRAIREKVLDPERADVVTQQRGGGKYAEAEPLYERCQAIQEKTLGPTHPKFAATLNNRAGLFKSQGKYEEANSLYLRGLEILGATVGEEHPDCASALSDRAGVLRM
ncbi:unnamed protein product [Ectocarpus sp. 12 AP-2014]